MKNKIYYSPAAQRDLDEIWDYISLELCNVEAAEKTVTQIMDSVDYLEDFAELGAPLSSIITVESEYRFLVCGNYLVFYRVNVQEIHIDRILYGKINDLSILFPELPQEEADEQ